VIEKTYKDRYKDWFGDKFRITIPLEEVSNTYTLVNDTLSDYGFTISDWKAGQCVSLTTPNKPRRIGVILNDKGEQDVLKAFNERNKGKATAEESKYTVVISRHPYDIIGQSFDRQWDSCKNFVDGVNKRYIPMEVNLGSLVAYVVQKKSETKELLKLDVTKPKEVQDFANKFTKAVGKPIISIKKYLRYPNEIYRAILDKEITIDDLMAEYPEEATKCLTASNDILSDPIARYLIVPYISEDDPNDTMLMVSESVYGKHVEGFKETIQHWLDLHQGVKLGHFVLPNTVYNDNNSRSVTRIDSDKISVNDFATDKEQRRLYKVYKTADQVTRIKIKKLFNQYVLSLKSINNIVDLFIIHAEQDLLPIARTHLYELYKEYFSRPVEMENHIYKVIEEYEYPNFTMYTIKLLPAVEQFLFDMSATLTFNRWSATEEPKNPLEQDKHDELVDLLCKAITEQQEYRKQIVQIKDTGYNDQRVNKTIKANNKELLPNNVEMLEMQIGKRLMLYTGGKITEQQLTYDRAKDACKKLSDATGEHYRLPTLEEIELIAQYKRDIHTLKPDQNYWTFNPRMDGIYLKQLVFNFKREDSNLIDYALTALVLPVRDI
jgi:hypothetical protein